MKLRVAGAQIPVTMDINQNYETLCRSVDYAINEKADNYQEDDNNTCYNQIRFYDKTGSLLGFHSKILLTILCLYNRYFIEEVYKKLV